MKFFASVRFPYACLLSPIQGILPAKGLAIESQRGSVEFTRTRVARNPKSHPLINQKPEYRLGTGDNEVAEVAEQCPPVACTVIFLYLQRDTVQRSRPSCYATFVTVYRDRVTGSTEKYAPAPSELSARTYEPLGGEARVPRRSRTPGAINPGFDGEIYAVMRSRWHGAELALRSA